MFMGKYHAEQYWECPYLFEGFVEPAKSRRMLPVIDRVVALPVILERPRLFPESVVIR